MRMCIAWASLLLAFHASASSGNGNDVAARLAVVSEEPADDVSALHGALAEQLFSLNVTAGGAIVLLAPSLHGWDIVSNITSSFSEPGPIWNNFSDALGPTAWSVDVSCLGVSAI